VKPVDWVGDSRRAVRTFARAARVQLGRELFRLQLGEDPLDWKPMRAIGPAACEIRVRAGSQYRLVYVAKFQEAIYVLHAFTKKSQATRLQDIRTARDRYRVMIDKRGAR
jgi:phage-related protein